MGEHYLCSEFPYSSNKAFNLPSILLSSMLIRTTSRIEYIPGLGVQVVQGFIVYAAVG